MSVNRHLLTPIHTSGPAPEAVGAAVILIHGRTQNPKDMLSITDRMQLNNVPLIAIEAHENSWYPGQFMEPINNNQPHLDHALELIDKTILDLEQLGVPRSRILLMGFSQGACLACEYVYRHPARWGGLIAYTGGLIGPDTLSWVTPHLLHGTPVWLSNGDNDPWVPLPRTEQTACILARMGAWVQMRNYQGRGHEVNDDEIILGKQLITNLMDSTKQ